MVIFFAATVGFEAGTRGGVVGTAEAVGSGVGVATGVGVTTGAGASWESFILIVGFEKVNP